MGCLAAVSPNQNRPHPPHLLSGIPSIIMPFFGDHFLWAQRLQEMGCGPHAMPLKSTQPQELAATLRSVLKDPKIAEVISVCGGGVVCFAIVCVWARGTQCGRQKDTLRSVCVRMC